MKNYTKIPFIDLEPMVASNIEVNAVGSKSDYTFYNLTGSPIFVIYRSGIVTRIMPSFTSSTSLVNKFIIRTGITIPDIKNVHFPNHDGGLADATTIIHNGLAISSESNPYASKSAYYDSQLGIDLLKEHKTVYLRKFDILVSLKGNVLHPYSQAFSTRKMMQEKQSTTSTDLSIIIVDNLGVLGTQYIRLYEKVQSIIPVKDAKRSDGVYITRTLYKKDKNGNAETRCEWSRLSDHRIDAKGPKKPLIFSNYDEAKNHSSLNDREKREYEKSLNDIKKLEMSYKEKELHHKERERKLEMENKERELAHKDRERKLEMENKANELRYREAEKAREAEIKHREYEARERELELRKKIMELDRTRRADEEKVDSIKREYSMDTIKEKQKISEMELKLKQEQQRLSALEMKHKKELMELKEGYERRSTHRKDVSESIRMVPIIVAGVAAIAGYYYGKKSN